VVQEVSETPVKFHTGNQKYQEFTKLGYNYAQNKKRRKNYENNAGIKHFQDKN
jgi:hypothetical protein